MLLKQAFTGTGVTSVGLGTLKHSMGIPACQLSCFFVLFLLTSVESADFVGEWGDWTTCTADCDGGKQYKDKFCDGQLCDRIESSCHLMPCDDPFGGVLWGDCTKSCGGGTRTRTNSDGQSETIRCNTHSCRSGEFPDHASCISDVVFVLDSSGSLSRLNWAIILQFVIDTMKGLNISPEGTHVGVVIFSTEAQVSFGLNDYFSMSDIENVVFNLEYMAGMSHTAEGIEAMHRLFIDQGRGTNEAKQIGVVVSDYVSSLSDFRVIPEAMSAKDDGIEMFVVAPDEYADFHEMIGIASSGDNVFIGKTYSVMQDLIDPLTAKLCLTADSVSAVCGECGDYGACSESCGADGRKVGTKDCWTVNELTGREIPSTRQTHTCSTGCLNRCPTTTTEPWKVDCSRYGTAKGQIWLEDLNNCHMYYICESYGYGYYRKHHMNCGEFYWNHAFHACMLSCRRMLDA